MKLKSTLVASALMLMGASSAFGQVFFTEDFEGTMDAGTNIPTGWIEAGLSTDGIWNVADAATASSTYLTWPAPGVGTNFAYTNDDDCNCDKSAELIVLPTQNFSTYSGVTLSADIYVNGGYGETFHCLASINGGTTWDTVAVFSGDPANWQAETVSLNAYAGQAAVTIGFIYNDASTWAYGAGIDNVTLEVPPSFDVVMSDTTNEYSIVPLDHVTPIGVDGIISNVGGGTVTNATLNVNVYDGTMTNVYSASSTPIASLASGTSQTATVAGYTPTATDLYTIELIASITEADANASNDTVTYQLLVDDSTYARDLGTIDVTLGIGVGSTATLGNNYTLQVDDTMTTVTFFSIPGADGLGDTIKVSVYDTNAGVPNALIGGSAEYYITAADTAAAGVTLTLPVFATGGAPLILTAGDYYVGIEEYTATNNMALGQSLGWETPNAVYGNINGGAFATIESFGFPGSFIVRPNFALIPGGCANTAGSISETICPGATYTAPSGATFTMAGNYTDIIPNACGADSVISIALAVTAVDNGATETGGVITASATGATYQWHDCDSGMDIAGETNQTFTPSVTGNYAVIVTENGCTDTSACIAVTVGGLLDLDSKGHLSIYPNPSNGEFDLSINGISGDVVVEIVSINGQLVKRMDVTAFDALNLPIDISTVEAGTYLVKITADNESITKRIVKK